MKSRCHPTDGEACDRAAVAKGLCKKHYNRAMRAAQGARTGQPGRPATQPCGTLAAYRRHLKAGEIPCEACKAANAERTRDYYRSRKG